MSEDQDQGGQQPVDDDGSVRFHPPITSTTHILPFERLSPLDFERLCLWLVEREGYTHAEHLGLAGSEQGRDVIAYKPTSQGEELWYFQCKRYRSIRARTLKDEVDKYLKFAQEKPHLKPFGVVFVVSCAVSAGARAEVGAYCEQHNLASEFWALTELDLRVKRHPDLLREFFGLYPRPIGGPFQAPPLPAHFVPRPEVSDALKAHLLADETTTPGVLVVSAIHGLGGIGKSVLAAALAHDPEVHERFPGGVLWATLGQQPELLYLLSGWIQALGDYGSHPTTVETASAHLRTLLQDKAALLVVDDAWDSDHVGPFLVGGPRCRLLITTRRADVVDEIGAKLHQLDVMTPEQSLTLLSARLGRALEGTEREEASLLAEAVGYLPLALELAAARVARGISWAVLCCALEQEVARLEGLEGPRRRRKRHTRIEASFNLSLNALCAEDEAAWQSFVWLGVLSENVAVTAPMVATLWGVEEDRAAELLELLWNDALLLPGSSVQAGEETWPSYRLHDLLYDIAHHLLTLDQPQGLGLTLQEAHATLLKRYQVRTQSGQWHLLPDDGYIHAHLTWHMEQAGQLEAIHALLSEETAEGQNGWYQAREQLGQMAGYLTDVVRAWRLAEEESTNHQLPTTIGLQCRYALITASLNSLAKNIPPALLAALVEKEVWTPAQGLTYARQVPEPAQQAAALAALSPHLLEPVREQALWEALTAAQEIKDEERQARMLVGLAPRLPEPLLREALIAAQAIRWEYAQAEALAGLAPHLPKALLQEALAAAQVIESEEWRAKALANLMLYLPEPLLQVAMSEMQFTGDEDDLARALAGLAPHLPTPFWLAKSLGDLRSYLPEPLLRKALAVTQTIKHEYIQALALASLASHLPEPLLREALEAAHAIRWEYAQAEALAGLAPHLSEPLLHKALAAAYTIKDNYGRAQVLTSLAPHLPEPLKGEALREVLAAAQSLPEDSSIVSPRAKVLATLAPHLPDPLLQKALMAAQALPENGPTGGPRAYVLTALVPHLPEPLRGETLEKALAAAQAIENQYWRAQALAALAPYLSESLLRRALAAAQVIGGEVTRAETLAALALHLVEPLRSEALEEALAAVQAIKPDIARWLMLVLLLPYLTEPLLRRILSEVISAQLVLDERSQTVLLTEHAQRLAALELHNPKLLKGEFLWKALATTHAIRDKYDQMEALAALAPRLAELGYPQDALSEEEIAEQLESVVPRLSGSRSWLAKAGGTLVLYLPKPLLRKVAEGLLEMVAETRSMRRVEDLEGLVVAPPLPGPLLRRVLAVLALYLPQSLLRKLIALARVTLDEHWLAKVVVSLTPHLPELLLREVLAAVQSIGSEKIRGETQVGLAPYLPEPLLREAFAAAQAIVDDKIRAKTLASLTPHLPESLLREVLAAQSIDNQGWQGLVLAGLVARLTEVGYSEEALVVAQTIESPYFQVQALVGVVPHLPELLLGRVLEVARAIPDESTREWGLARLALRLAERDYLHEALATVHAIESSDWRRRVLTDLASHLVQLPNLTLYSLWLQALPVLANRSHWGLLEDLQALSPVIAALGGPEAVKETIRAIQDVGRWWP